MVVGHFLLHHDDFSLKYAEAFEELRKTNELHDVTLACGDATVSAHKLVLSASSPYFRSILAKLDQPKPFIFLKGVQYNDLIALMDYIYKGETKIAIEDLKRFMELAEELSIQGLTEAGLFENLLQTKQADVLEKPELSVGVSNDESTTLVMGKDNDVHINEKEIEQYLIEVPETVEQVKTENVQDNSSNLWKSETSKLIRRIQDHEKCLWECINCGKTHIKKAVIQDHAETHIKQLGLFTYLCKFCGKQPQTKYALKHHIKIAHKNERVA